MGSSDNEEGPKRQTPTHRTPWHHGSSRRLQWAGWTSLNAVATLATAALLRSLPADDRALFFLYYQPLVPALAMLWFWAAAVWHWERLGARYGACFSPDDARCLLPSAALFHVTTVISACATLSGALFLYHLARGQRVAALWQPVLMYGGGAAALLYPGPAMHGEARRLFTGTLCRVALPIHAVSWADFWLADVATSLSKSIADGARATCALVAGPALAGPGRACGEAGWIVPLGLAMPYAIRLVQCLRVLRDTGARPQALNALKYATAFPTIALAAAGAAADREAWVGTLRPLWIAAALLNALYSYYWDVERDWEIGFFSQMEVQKRVMPQPVLASPAMYPRAFYLYLMASNLVMRLAWMYKLSDSLRLNTLVVSCFAILEVFRRFQWMFVRTEVELRKLQNHKPELGLTLLGHMPGTPRPVRGQGQTPTNPEGVCHEPAVTFVSL